MAFFSIFRWMVFFSISLWMVFFSISLWMTSNYHGPLCLWYLKWYYKSRIKYWQSYIIKKTNNKICYYVSFRLLKVGWGDILFPSCFTVELFARHKNLHTHLLHFKWDFLNALITSWSN
jgi:hypothetical protein